MFDTVKAYQLYCQYIKNGYYERAKFIKQLIENQIFFKTKSIVECELRRRTDFSILDFPITQHTIIAFTDPEGE